MVSDGMELFPDVDKIRVDWSYLPVILSRKTLQPIMLDTQDGPDALFVLAMVRSYTLWMGKTKEDVLLDLQAVWDKPRIRRALRFLNKLFEDGGTSNDGA